MEKSNIDESEVTITCSKCGIEILEHKRNEHDMRCVYAFNISDFENLIPCELCQELISCEDYELHTRQCMTPYRNYQHNMNNSNTSTSAMDDIQSQINNDPVARVLFNFMVGQPLPTPQSTEGINSIQSYSTTSSTNNTLIDTVDNDTLDNDTLDNDTVDNDTVDNNPFIEFLNNLPNTTNNIQTIETFITNIIAGQLPFDSNSNININEQLMNFEDLSNLDDVEVGIHNIDNVSTLQFVECDCPICCQTCLLSRKTKCGHIYCDTCLSEWLHTNKKCPTCMIELE